MRDYKIILLNFPRFDAPALVVKCETDEDAQEIAQVLSAGDAVDIWEGLRPVARLNSPCRLD
jgi:hypothetical protein